MGEPRERALDGVQIAPCQGAVFRAKDMHGMLDDTAVMWAKIDEMVDMPFSLWTWVDPRSIIRWGVHWRNLANIVEPSMCVGDAAFVKLL